ncbi:MAG: class I SAM-dependent methyltransferase [Bacteroidota bacterium]
MSVNRLATRLTAVGERHLKSGHPWLYDRAIERIKGSGKAGDLAIIFDRRKDKFIGIGLYDPDSPIRIKVLHQGGPVQVNDVFWANEVAKAKQGRAPLLANQSTNSYRLLNGENDGFPGLIADVYAQTLVIKIYSLIWAPHLNSILPALVSNSDASTVVLRLSRRVASAPQCPEAWSDGATLYGTLDQEEVQFKEHGVRLKANVLRGHKTGFFLDHRHNRKIVGELAKGKQVLDIFSYAGGFSAHAIVGGASLVTALDISEQALAVAQENIALNADTNNFQTLRGDVFEILPKLKRQQLQYDLIICDPPSFAKSAAEVPGALKAYRRLTNLCLSLVAPGGILLAASCSARVDSVTFYALQEDVLKASGRRFKQLQQTQHDIDHPATFKEGYYLKSAYYQLF